MGTCVRERDDGENRGRGGGEGDGKGAIDTWQGMVGHGDTHV